MASRLGLLLRCASFASLATAARFSAEEAVASSGGREAVASHAVSLVARRLTSAAPCARRAWFWAAPPLVTAPADEGTRAAFLSVTPALSLLH